MTDNPGSVAVEGLKVVPLFDRRALLASSGENVDRFELDATGFSLEGIDFGSLIEEVDVVVGLLLQQMSKKVT